MAANSDAAFPSQVNFIPPDTAAIDQITQGTLDELAANAVRTNERFKDAEYIYNPSNGEIMVNPIMTRIDARGHEVPDGRLFDNVNSGLIPCRTLEEAKEIAKQAEGGELAMNEQKFFIDLCDNDNILLTFMMNALDALRHNILDKEMFEKRVRQAFIDAHHKRGFALSAQIRKHFNIKQEELKKVS